MSGSLRSSFRTMAIVAVAGVGLLSAVVFWRRVNVLDRLVASQGRPYVHQSFIIRRLFNPIAVLGGTDAVLFVRGRHSGKRLSVPVAPPFEYEGRRYLVSPLGDTHWARNLRAAGEGVLRYRPAPGTLPCGRARRSRARRDRDGLWREPHLRVQTLHGEASRSGRPPGLPDRAVRVGRRLCA